MTTFTAYKNHGLLAHELETIWSAAYPIPDAVVSEKAELELPQGWSCETTMYGGLVFISPEGEEFFDNEALKSHADKPFLFIKGEEDEAFYLSRPPKKSKWIKLKEVDLKQTAAEKGEAEAATVQGMTEAALDRAIEDALDEAEAAQTMSLTR